MNRKVSLPARGKFQSYVRPLLDRRLSASAYRLYSLILCLSRETGSCDLDNAELGALLGLSREYVRRLLGEIAMDLVQVRTLEGRRVLQPVALDLAEDSALYGRRLFEPEDVTIGLTTPKNNGAGEDFPSCTPHENGSDSVSVNYSCSLASTIVDASDRRRRLINTNLKDSSSSFLSSTIVDDKAIPSTIVDDMPEFGLDLSFAAIMARWDRCFGDIRTSEADILSDYLDDPELAATATAAGETPADWIQAAIIETDLAKARNPIKYLRAVLNDWLKRGSRTPKGETNAVSSGSSTSGNDAAAATIDRDAAIRDILDRFDSGQLGPAEAKEQLAGLGYVL